METVIATITTPVNLEPNILETNKKVTPVKKRTFNKDKKSEEIPLTPQVISEIIMLGGKIEKIKEARTYRESGRAMPEPIQTFCDAFMNMPTQKSYKNEKRKLDEVILGQEFSLEEWNEYQYLVQHDSTAILIGEGDALIVASLLDSTEDFDIFLNS